MFFSASATSGSCPSSDVNQKRTTANSMQNYNYNIGNFPQVPISHHAPGGYIVDRYVPNQYIYQQPPPPQQYPPQLLSRQPLQHQQQVGAPSRKPAEMQRGSQDDVLVVELQQSFSPASKPYVRWTPELDGRFLNAVQDLGGIFRATPAAILKKMKVQGLTYDHIKSHLQKVRIESSSCISVDEPTSIRTSSNNASQFSPGEAHSSGTGPMIVHPHFNGNGLQFRSFQEDIQEYGRLLANSETPNHSQNVMVATSSPEQHKNGGYWLSK